MQVATELARFRDKALWTPRVSDFIILHQYKWFFVVKVWFGVVTDVNVTKGVVTIVRDSFPKLLFTMSEYDREINSIAVPISKIKGSRALDSEYYTILQNDTWYVDS